MRFAYREVATPGMGWVVAGISFGLLAIVAALGPMDTLRTLTLVQRLAYFGLVTVLKVPVYFACGFFVLYVLRDSRLVCLAAALALMCAVVTASGAALAMILYGPFHGGASPKATFSGVYAFGVLISAVGTALSLYVLYLRVSRTTQRDGAVEPDSGAPLPARTAPRKRLPWGPPPRAPQPRPPTRHRPRAAARLRSSACPRRSDATSCTSTSPATTWRS